MRRKTLKIQFLGTILGVCLFSVLGIFNDVSADATLYFTASTTKVYPGNTFTVYPRVNTGGTVTNAYAVNITFPSGLIQPVNISKGGSICTLFTQEPSYTSSTAAISCGLPAPGYNGSNGILGSITFKAITKGSATISMTGASQVLAHDGQGTNILGTRGNITINITDPPPPPIASPTVTASVGSDGEWVSTKEITLTWNSPSGATGFSYIFTEDQSIGAGRTNQGKGTSKTYQDLADGVYYFKIVATNGSQWGQEATYTLRIDTTPPESLEIVSDPSNGNEIDRLPFISFNATDATSGIDHYEIKIDDGDFITVENPYQIEEITSGEHTITVKAVDKAGNSKEESIVLNIVEVQSPIITKPKNGRYLPLGEYLIVEGTAIANSTVYIYLNGELIAEVIADGKGNFSYTYEHILLQESYEIYAISKNEGGIFSLPSENVSFKVDTYAIKIWNIVIPSYCLAFILLTLILALLLIIIIIYRRYKSYRKRVKSNIRKARKKIGKEFDELERDTRNEIEETLGQKKKRKVSKDLEHELKKDLTKEILEAEMDIKKEIKKIPYGKKKLKKK